MPESSAPSWNRPEKPAPIWRALIEAGFIVFLYYSNLLMGEYERSGQGTGRGLLWALRDIFTAANFTIAIATALVGHLIFEFLRKRF
jgi:dolichol kinase